MYYVDYERYKNEDGDLEMVIFKKFNTKKDVKLFLESIKDDLNRYVRIYKSHELISVIEYGYEKF